MGLREIGAVSATVDSTETGSYNPDVVAATAVSPSSEHIPVTRAAGITEVLAVPGSGGFDSGGSSNMIGGQASAIHLAGWAIDEMLIKRARRWRSTGRRSRRKLSTSPPSRERETVQRGQAGIRQTGE